MDAERLLARLNHFTREMLEACEKTAVTLPPGYELWVSAYPDVVLEAPHGHWAGITRKDGDQWVLWRGSGRFTVDGERYGCLSDAVADIISGNPTQ